MSFDDHPRLEDARLILRGITGQDSEDLYRAANAPEIWAGHPSKDRYKREVFDPYFDMLVREGGTLVVIDKTSAKIIGCSRYYVGPDAPEDISIGFTFLNNLYWGGTVNFHMKQLMLDHAFQTFDRVWFHIAPDNIRSQRATLKLGAEFVGEDEIDLSGNPAPWKRFRLDKVAWQQIKAARSVG